MSLNGVKILVTGGTGFLGRYVVETLRQLGAKPHPISKSTGFDLRNEADVLQATLLVKPEVVIHLAALCGGIGANQASPGRFFRDNMQMGMNVVHAASVAQAKLVTVGTVCSYGAVTPTPFKEENFWKGYPEPTNAPYGIAKKAVHVMMEGYRQEFGLHYAYLVPANLYGPGDHFEDEKSHVIPAMVKKFVEAAEEGKEEVVLWGTGKPTRSFLFVADAAQAVAIAADKLDFPGIVNLPGHGEISMKDLAEKVAKLVGYAGKLSWDEKKPDGQARRSIDGTRAKKLLDWSPFTTLDAGLEATVQWYRDVRVSLQNV